VKPNPPFTKSGRKKLFWLVKKRRRRRGEMSLGDLDGYQWAAKPAYSSRAERSEASWGLLGRLVSAIRLSMLKASCVQDFRLCGSMISLRWPEFEMNMGGQRARHFSRKSGGNHPNPKP
jgi:hypothetical protein